MSVEVLTQGGGANLQSRSVSLTSTSATTFSPQSGYDGMSSITVTPNLQSKSVTLSSSSTTVSPDSGYSGLSSVTARTNNQSTQYVTPASQPQNITPSSGYSGLSGVYVYGDSNLISSNIKSGISIFGIYGSYEGESSGGTYKVYWTKNPTKSTDTNNRTLTFSCPSDCNDSNCLICYAMSPNTPTERWSFCTSWFYNKLTTYDSSYYRGFVTKDSSGSSISFGLDSPIFNGSTITINGQNTDSYFDEACQWYCFLIYS